MIPHSTNEEDTTFKLDGRNTATGAKFVGWTNNILRSFLGVKPNHAIQTLPFEDIHKVFSPQYEWKLGQFVRKNNGMPNMKLSGLLQKLENYGSFTIGSPTTVRVLEKQGLIVCPKEKGSVLIIGKIIIADSTGFCVAIMYNDSVNNIYNQVDIGDILIINGGTVKEDVSKSSENICFRQEKFLSMELRFKMFDSRFVYRVKPYAGDRRRAFEDYFPQKGTWLASELWNKSAEDFEFPTNCQCINLCGVISYVGCISRIEAKTKSDHESKMYYCFRWIQVTDRWLPKPLNIKLFLHNLNWDQQENVVPGIAIVLTNLTAVDMKSDFFEFYLQSTMYTKVHVNHEIASIYLTPLAKAERTLIRDVVSSSKCSDTLQRNDVDWSAGGTLFMPILNRDRFLQHVDEQFRNNSLDIWETPKADLARRETQRIYVRGFIYKVLKVSRDQLKAVTVLYWAAKMLPNMNLYNFSKPQENENFLPDYGKFWFSFPRKLMKLITEKTKDDVFETFEKNRAINADLCKPLLLPSKYPEENEPSLSRLPVLFGDSYFMVYIADPYNKRLYACMWKSFPLQVMEEKLSKVMTLDKPRSVKKSVLEERDMGKEEEKENGEPSSNLYEEEQAEKLKKKSIFIIDLTKIEKEGVSPMDENLQVSLVDFVNYDEA